MRRRPVDLRTLIRSVAANTVGFSQQREVLREDI